MLLNKCPLVHRQQLPPKKNYVSQSCTHADIESSTVGEKEAEMAGDTSFTAGHVCCCCSATVLTLHCLTGGAQFYREAHEIPDCSSQC